MFASIWFWHVVLSAALHASGWLGAATGLVLHYVLACSWRWLWAAVGSVSSLARVLL